MRLCFLQTTVFWQGAGVNDPSPTLNVNGGHHRPRASVCQPDIITAADFPKQCICINKQWRTHENENMKTLYHSASYDGIQVFDELAITC